MELVIRVFTKSDLLYKNYRHIFVISVEDEDCVDEIARMLGGKSSQSGRKHAEELLVGAGYASNSK